MSKRKAITNQYNKLRSWNYLNENREVEFSFLFEYTLFSDSTEELTVLHLNKTFNTKPPEFARNLASVEVKKYLEENYGKVYDPKSIYETVEPRNDGPTFKKNI